MSKIIVINNTDVLNFNNNVEFNKKYWNSPEEEETIHTIEFVSISHLVRVIQFPTEVARNAAFDSLVAQLSDPAKTKIIIDTI